MGLRGLILGLRGLTWKSEKSESVSQMPDLGSEGFDFGSKSLDLVSERSGKSTIGSERPGLRSE